MKIEIEVPEYSLETGIQYNWMDDFEIDIRMIESGVVIVANSAGLKSLANHFLNLAQGEIPSGTHLHFDEYNSLEEGAIELIIEKK